MAYEPTKADLKACRFMLRMREKFPYDEAVEAVVWAVAVSEADHHDFQPSAIDDLVETFMAAIYDMREKQGSYESN